MVSFHLVNIKFKRLTPNYGNGRKLKIIYKTDANEMIKKFLKKIKKSIFLIFKKYAMLVMERKIYGRMLQAI